MQISHGYSAPSFINMGTCAVNRPKIRGDSPIRVRWSENVAHQSLLWNFRERGQDPDMDHNRRLRSRGDHPQGTAAIPQPVFHSTDFERHALQENPPAASLLADQHNTRGHIKCKSTAFSRTFNRTVVKAYTNILDLAKAALEKKGAVGLLIGGAIAPYLLITYLGAIIGLLTSWRRQYDRLSLADRTSRRLLCTNNRGSRTCSFQASINPILPCLHRNRV